MHDGLVLANCTAALHTMFVYVCMEAVVSSNSRLLHIQSLSCVLITPSMLQAAKDQEAAKKAVETAEEVAKVAAEGGTQPPEGHDMSKTNGELIAASCIVAELWNHIVTAGNVHQCKHALA